MHRQVSGSIPLTGSTPRRSGSCRWGPFRGRTLVIWTACYLDCACALTLAGIISPESAGGAVTRSARLAMALPSAKEDENGEDQARPVDQPVAGAPSGSRADTADISDTSGGAWRRGAAVPLHRPRPV